MSVSLLNVYAYLRKTFQNVDMMLSKPVSYVKTLVDAEKIIFIYREVICLETNSETPQSIVMVLIKGSESRNW